MFATQELAFLTENAEALNQVEYAKTHLRIFVNSNSTYKKINSGYAIFAGVGSPLTQSIGLGFNGQVTEREIKNIELFYKNLNSPVYIEVSHFADMSLTQTENFSTTDMTVYPLLFGGGTISTLINRNRK
ncbi:MAG: hypothetical protein GXO75_05095 [Calditrichaeota bacterium]|nr:hypothetical protein [Calditrichota bacterium]